MQGVSLANGAHMLRTEGLVEKEREMEEREGVDRERRDVEGGVILVQSWEN